MLQTPHKRLFHFVWFTYSTKPRLHHQRDLGIFIQLLPILNKVGYQYEDTIFNYPNRSFAQADSKMRFSKDDLIVITTRPPIDDEDQVERRRIYKSGHFHESNFLDVLHENCFRVSARSHMKLRRRIAIHLKPEHEDRADIHFKLNKSPINPSANYLTTQAYLRNALPRPFKGARSAAYVIYLKSIGNCPAFLNVFGVGGQEGLSFSYILRHHLWKKLGIDFYGPSRFIMVEIDTNYKVAELECLSTLNQINYTVLLNEVLPV